MRDGAGRDDTQSHDWLAGRAGLARLGWTASGLAAAFAVLALISPLIPRPPVDPRWCAALSIACLNVFIAVIGARLLAARTTSPLDASPAPFWKTLLRLALQAVWRRSERVDARALVGAVRWQPWVVPLCAAVSALLAALAWRMPDTLSALPASAAGVPAPVIVGGAIPLAVAFAALVAERFHAQHAAHSRASAALVGLLRVVLAIALGAAASAVRIAYARPMPDWTVRGAAAFGAAISVELAIRSMLASWYAPPRATDDDTLPSGILAGLLRARTSPLAAVGAELRNRYGIDLRQNWVLQSFVRLLPAAVLLTGACGWLMTGVVILGPEQRAVYERFGAPVAVWQPGLHLALPWPFGNTRVIDNGAVHQLIVSGSASDSSVAAPDVPADARTPEQLNRLWDVAHPWDTTQVIAGTGDERQAFQIVSADVRLDYRIGLSDTAARNALYSSDDAAAVVRSVANREVVRYLASRTLESLIETHEAEMADTLRAAIQQQLDRLSSGIDVVAVVIESVHPPAGAAAAWHGVQAAQIHAQASVVDARGYAAGELGNARQQAIATVAEGGATAADTLAAARVQQAGFDADEIAHQLGGPAFAFEYYMHNLQTGLRNASVTVIDDRLVTGNRATIDLRTFTPGLATSTRPGD